MHSRTLLVAIVFTMFATTALAEDTDNACVGIWKLNLAKSRFEPGPAPREVTRIYEDAGAGQIRVTIKRVGSDGSTSTGTCTYREDGKDNPITVGQATPLSIAITRVDAYTITYSCQTLESLSTEHETWT